MSLTRSSSSPEQKIVSTQHVEYIENVLDNNEIQLMSTEQIKSYFNRIKIDEYEAQQLVKIPSIDTLNEIHRYQVINIHVTNFAMQDTSRMNLENTISPFFDEIFQKIVMDGKHGYCFENNQLLRHVLHAIGYKINFYNAHIIKDGIPKPDPQHVFLGVEINNREYLVDAGYGGVAPIAVMELITCTTQVGLGRPWQTTGIPENIYKITDAKFKFDGTHEENGFMLWHEYSLPNVSNKTWKPLYVFCKKPCDFNEFKEANRCVSDELASPFNKTLFETFFKDESTRVAMTQNEVHITKHGETILRKPVKSGEKYKKYLGKYFGVSETGNIRDRVIFGNATAECLLWHESYKNHKKENLSSCKEVKLESSNLSKI